MTVRVKAGGCWASVPRPRCGVFFEWTTVTLSVALADDMGADSVLWCDVVFELSAVFADVLCVVWPGRVLPGGRRDARRRLGREARRWLT